MTYGLLVEFDSAEKLLHGVRTAREHGYSQLDAYSPFPLEELPEALGRPPTQIGWWVGAGALFGGLSGYGMEYFASVISYPLDVGGRPMHSWPSFIPVTFELTVLGGALFALAALIFSNGFPKWYHPVFEVDAFRGASNERFFLCLRAKDPQFAGAREFFAHIDALAVHEVPG